MADLAQKSTQEILATLHAKDRRFKAFSVVFFMAVAVGLVALLLIGLNTLQGVNNQLHSQQKLLSQQAKTLSAVSAAAKQRSVQINDLQNHIDCIVELFQQPNRASLTITNLQGCELTGSGGVKAGGTNSDGTTQKVGTAPSNNTGSATSTPQSSSQSTAPTSVPAQTPQTPQTTGVVPKVVNNLFCPINLANLTCSK